LIKDSDASGIAFKSKENKHYSKRGNIETSLILSLQTGDWIFLAGEVKPALTALWLKYLFKKLLILMGGKYFVCLPLIVKVR
jgi:hypothetical protein